MKKYLFLFLSLAFLSCNNESEKLRKEISSLKAENDSLNTVLDTLKTKYIFDGVLVKHIVNENKPMKDGEKYKGEFYFVAFNDNDKVLFRQDANSKPDTLTEIRGGGYIYEFSAKKGENNFIFNPLVLDKIAMEFTNVGYGGITISDKRTVD